MSYASPSTSSRFVALLKHRVGERGSASAVARELGLSPSYVAKLLRGEGGGRVREQTVRDVFTRLKLRDDALDRVEFDPIELWREQATERAPTERDVRLAIIAGAVGLGIDAPPREVLVRVIDLVIEAERG
jgi:transcriptional regulator with XRE-family HTH domain